MKLNPDFIPHEDFHKGLWLKTKKCPWFFFYETPREFTIPNNESFYNTVDDDLKLLVEFLHRNNIPTTPSCSGHIHDDNHNSQLFESIKNISKDLETGLTFNDPENKRKFFYKNKSFKLPWEKNQFIDNITEYQGKGVLGFIDKNNKLKKVSKMLPIQKKGNVSLIMTDNDSQKAITKNWKEITEIIKNSL
jgi:hypothetical protein